MDVEEIFDSQESPYRFEDVMEKNVLQALFCGMVPRVKHLRNTWISVWSMEWQGPLFLKKDRAETAAQKVSKLE